MKKFFSLIAAVLFAGSMMAETYTKTAYADLKSGDVVIITEQKGDNVYAASNDQGTSKAPVATAVTVAEDAITTDATNILWTVEKDGDNISFKAGDSYLYCTNANNGMRVGSGDAKVFSIDSESGYLYNNGTSRYIGVYNAADFRCYTTVNTNITGQTLAFYAVAGGEVPPTVKYYLAGSMSGWAEAVGKAAYELAANPAAEGEYMAEFTFAANDEFKVIGYDGETQTWYPGGMDNNYKITEAGDYTVYFRPAGGVDGWHEGYIYAAKKVIPQYEVAEAIAAGLTKDTEILVRGVITKMEFKGKNFAKYGSVNIYVADATGAEGAFEFYNCYSLNADTFRTSTPAYDAQSTDWVEFEEVADENGNAVHVGDTVIAFGKYQLYNETYELNTGCYLTEIKSAGDAPAEEGDAIYDWAGEIGTTILGTTGVEISTVKIHENTDDANGIKFGSSYVYAEGKYIAIKPAEGGFKAGDVLSVSVVFNNANTNLDKYAQIDLRAADGDTRIWLSDSASTINGRLSAADPIVQTYTLEADQDSLLLGRYGNTAMFVTLLKVTRALVPPTPQPTINYYVIGSMTEWNVDANYKLVANPAVEGEYMGEFTFANNDEFKIAGDDGSQLIWYPGGTDNNYKITEAGDYKITFNPAGNVEGWYAGYYNVVKKEEPVIPQYEVAEAIAAGLAEGDEVLVRGVITKMEFKGANFAKYGSVNIYVADATGAEGEFEFYNCFSFNADTFKTSTPAYDATSTAWAEFKMVADENGNEIRVGDTIIAQGKYKLFNETHELNTGCYITDLKPAPVAPAQDINVNMSDGLRYDDYVASDGWWQIYGSDEQYSVSISNVATTQAEGTYTIADLDADYTYITAINSTDTTHFVDGSVILSIDAQTGNVTVAGTLVGDDGNNYILNLQFIVPKPTETVNVNIQNAELIDYYADYGLYGVSGTDANDIYVQIAIWAENGFQGQFTEEDLDLQYIGSGILEGEEQVNIYTAAITVTPGNGGDYNVTATILGYNNKQYNVTMYVPGGEGIEETLAAGKAAKVLRDGQVLILKGDKTFNVMGARIR